LLTFLLSTRQVAISHGLGDECSTASVDIVFELLACILQSSFNILENSLRVVGSLRIKIKILPEFLDFLEKIFAPFSDNFL